MSNVSVAPATMHRPLYGASFGQAVSRFWRNYVNFSGRASRSEFWWATLFLAIVYLPLSFLAIVMGDGHLDLVTGRYVVGPGYYLVTGLTWLWSLAVLLPSLSLTWRRLHDTNRSGLLYLLVLIPFVGVLIVFILVLLNSNPAGARFDRPEA